MKKAGVLIPELMRNLAEKPVTILYPFVEVTVPEGFRGTPRFVSDKCIGCRACVRDCTAEAIEIDVKKIDPAPEEAAAGAKPQKKCIMVLYLDRCVHCARCVEVCPKDALFMDQEFEVANFTRDALRLVQE